MDITIISAEEKYMDQATKIAIDAWTPIREEFKRLLGDEIYASQFTDWQAKKAESLWKSILQPVKAVNRHFYKYQNRILK